MTVKAGYWTMMALAGALAGCSASEPPSAAGRAPLASPAYYVTIPVPAAQPLVPTRAPGMLQQTVTSLVAGFPGKAGAAVRAVDEGWTVEAGGRQRLAQQSVSKLWVAMTVLDQRDRGLLRLDDPIVVTKADLTLFHQPLAWLVRDAGYQTTVADLLTRALTQSDNTANDRLLTLVGGPAAVRDFLARKQLGGIRFGPGERLLQAGTAGLVWNQSMSAGGAFEAARARLDPNVRQAAMEAYVQDPPDGATPLGIADALARLERGELLSETSTRILLTTMGATVTGRARLKAVLPYGWKLAHKTGTGQELGRRNAGFNDVGVLTAPNGKRYAIAVMIGDTMRPMRERQRLIQAVAAAVTGQRTLPATTIASGEDEDAAGS